MKSRDWFVVLFASLAATGCHTTGQIAVDFPPAKTPVLTSLQAAPSATGAFATVAADGPIIVTDPFISTPGVFRVLPSGLPSGLPRGVVKVFFTAPSLLTLKVNVDGNPLYKFADVPPGLDPRIVGYYRVETVDSSDNWQVTIHPPFSSTPRFALTINIVTVSINPNYATGPNHESAPLVIKLAAKPFRLGFAQPMSGGPCALVPNFPLLRPGLTVSVADALFTQIFVGCCTFPSDPNVGTEGLIAGGPAGVSFPFAGFRKYSLVMRVGNQLAQGIWKTTFTTNQVGPLEVCINDDDLVGNSGAWGIDIRISE